MKFNLLETGYLTVSGTVYVSLENMSHILSASGTVTISGSGGDNISFYGDIVDRIGVYQIRYYFNSATSSGTVASGIHFYYKDDAADSYINLTTNVGDGYYYATVPGLSAPRYIMLNHTLSGTSIEGQIVGLQVLNDDSIVDFGTDGTKTTDTTMTSLNYLNYNDYIKEIPVYNSGDTSATAHIFLEPQYEDVDELISISASSSGPLNPSRSSGACRAPPTAHYCTETSDSLRAIVVTLSPSVLRLAGFAMKRAVDSMICSTSRSRFCSSVIPV